MRADQIAEILGQLHFRKIVDAVAKILTQATNRPRVGINRLGLQPLEFQMLEVAVVLLGKVRRETGRHAGLSF